MTLRLGSVFAQAAALWKRDSALLWPVVGLFSFLPRLAFLLLVPPPAIDATMPDEKKNALVAAYLPTFMTALPFIWLFVSFGAAVVLTLYLNPERPDLRRAMAQAARRFPVYLVVLLGVSVVLFAGLMLFVVPFIYLLGRLWLCGPSVIARPGLDMGSAVSEALALTEGRALSIFSICLLPFVGLIATMPIADGIAIITQSITGPGLAVTVVSAIVSALASAAYDLICVLLQVVVYRTLTAPRQGI